MRLIRYTPVLLLLALSACVYSPDIKQGNYLKPAMIEQVKPGMTKEQVHFLMGPPMIQDPFHTDRWDYVYYNVPSSLSSNRTISNQHVTVLFKDGKVTSIEQSPVADKSKAS